MANSSHGGVVTKRATWRTHHDRARSSPARAPAGPDTVAVSGLRVCQRRHPRLLRRLPQGATASTWDPRVTDIVQFVERRRGLQFKHPVPVDFLDTAAFDAKVTFSKPPSATQQASLDESVATLRAVGLLQGAPDLRAAG